MKKQKLLCYTRNPMDEMVYSRKLAYSMHLAISEDGITHNPLNNNLGILYAKATANPDGTLNAKSLKQPYLMNLTEGGYGVLAIRTLPAGEDDEESKGCILVFKSKDLIQYEEVGLLQVSADDYIHDVLCRYDEEQQRYLVQWKNGSDQWYQTQVDSLDCLIKHTIASVYHLHQLKRSTQILKDVYLVIQLKLLKRQVRKIINRLTNPKLHYTSSKRNYCGLQRSYGCKGRGYLHRWLQGT